MTPPRTTLALLLLVKTVLLAAGCISGSVGGNVTIPSPNTVETKEITYYDDIAFKDPMTAWRANLTYPWTKIAPNILVFIDPGYPVSMHGNTGEQLKQIWIRSRVAIPADEGITRFNLTNKTGHTVGEHVFVTIRVYPNSSTHILDPFVTQITSRQEELHGVETWVDVNNLEYLAALDGVRDMKFVEYGEHSEKPVTAP
jgi:hypothetical protein